MTAFRPKIAQRILHGGMLLGLWGVSSTVIAQTVFSTSQFTYDSVGRLQCTAIRMNPGSYSNLPSSACVQGTAGVQGPDRITQNVYDAAGQLVQIIKGVGSPQQQAFATYGYSHNGMRTDVVDANGNHSQLVYDGFDRQSQLVLPSTIPAAAFNSSSPSIALATSNTPDGSDYEAYAYDANDNRTSLRKRDGSVLSFQYDALNRVIVKSVPQRANLPGTDARSVYYSYDLVGHQLTAWFDSFTSAQGVSNGFDYLGRLTATSLTMDGYSRAISYVYDQNNNRTQVIYPDGASVYYAYDNINRPTTITTSAGTLPASYTYNPDGTRTGYTSNGSAFATSYAYDGIDRLISLVNLPAAGGSGNAFNFQYNPAHQITQKTVSNNSFVYTKNYSTNQSYSTNGLNQYSSVGGVNYTYDANGNLISDGANTYVYDIENRMVNAIGGHAAALRYDPLGRIYEVVNTSTGVTTRFLYGGDELMVEYDGSGNLQRRYAHGADLRVDNPIAWYEGPSFSSANERLLRPNWQGSIQHVTDTAGNAIGTNIYDEYGASGTGNIGRFQYTGQVWLSEIGLYYYKARIYSPVLGRFMQADPIGYGDGPDWYLYVGDDPLNRTDPSGEDTFLVTRIVFLINHHSFVVVTDKQGNVVRRYSYSPSLDGFSNKGNFGSLVSATNSKNNTDRDDNSAWNNRNGAHLPGFHVYNMTERGWSDAKVIKAGDELNRELGSLDSPGTTKYNPLPDGNNGDGNSNSGAYRVLADSRPSADSIVPNPLMTPGSAESGNIGIPNRASTRRHPVSPSCARTGLCGQ